MAGISLSRSFQTFIAHLYLHLSTLRSLLAQRISTFMVYHCAYGFSKRSPSASFSEKDLSLALTLHLKTSTLSRRAAPRRLLGRYGRFRAHGTQLTRISGLMHRRRSPRGSSRRIKARPWRWSAGKVRSAPSWSGSPAEMRRRPALPPSTSRVYVSHKEDVQLVAR